jgi:hypothetical protein
VSTNKSAYRGRLPPNSLRVGAADTADHSSEDTTERARSVEAILEGPDHATVRTGVSLPGRVLPGRRWATRGRRQTVGEGS